MYMIKKYTNQISSNATVFPRKSTVAFLLNFSKSIRFYKTHRRESCTEINLN
jgi:hypothetical protein